MLSQVCPPSDSLCSPSKRLECFGFVILVYYFSSGLEIFSYRFSLIDRDALCRQSWRCVEYDGPQRSWLSLFPILLFLLAGISDPFCSPNLFLIVIIDWFRDENKKYFWGLFCISALYDMSWSPVELQFIYTNYTGQMNYNTINT